MVNCQFTLVNPTLVKTRRAVEGSRTCSERNQQVADRLLVGLPTVKRHLANADGKLGVGHRTEAVARATALDLL